MDWPISWNDVKEALERSKPYIIDLDEIGITPLIQTLGASGGGEDNSVSDDHVQFWRSIPVDRPIILKITLTNHVQYINAEMVEYDLDDDSVIGLRAISTSVSNKIATSVVVQLWAGYSGAQYVSGFYNEIQVRVAIS